MDHLDGARRSGSVLEGTRVLAAGDGAVVIEFGDTIERALLRRVSALDRHVCALAEGGRLPGFVESVPTFRSLALVLDPLLTTPGELLERIDGESAPGGAGGEAARREWELPVRYGGREGPDLDELAERTGLAPDALVARHAATPLAVYMLGFLPGFAFLGDIDPALRQPRREKPRLRVPAGSVAVANGLSAVYPWESPGGWHLIGHCPVPLFDAARAVPALLRADDAVRFRAIGAEEHAALVEARAAGRLDPTRFRVPGEADATPPGAPTRATP